MMALRSTASIPDIILSPYSHRIVGIFTVLSAVMSAVSRCCFPYVSIPGAHEVSRLLGVNFELRLVLPMTPFQCLTSDTASPLHSRWRGLFSHVNALV